MTEIETIRAALIAFIEQSGYSQKQIADESGLSTAAVSGFINGSYSGDNKKIGSTLNKYLTVAKERLNCRNADVFYPELRNTKLVTYAVHHAHKYCEMVLIRGDSGAGKTTALKAYVEQHAGVIFVTANASTKSATAILSMIAAAAGRRPSGGIKSLMDMLVSFLKNTKRLIIIDEADHLTLNALQAVRNLNDEAGVGIVLAGNEKLYQQMDTRTRGYEFDQIRTRISMKPCVINSYTEDEIAHIFPDCDERVCAILCNTATKESLRAAKKLYNFCMEYAASSNKKLTDKLILQLKENIG